MMELEYSPRHADPGALHLLSPTHARSAALDRFSISQIRRSLSRSPSKPARSHTSSVTSHPKSAPVVVACDSIPRQKLFVRRTGPVRTASRKSSPNSPLRRALGDSHNSANATPPSVRRCVAAEPVDQENMDCSAPSSAPRFGEPTKLDFQQINHHLQPTRLDLASPMKSSPLKRCDGIMDLEAASSASPRVKRRSLRASSPIDISVFDHGFDGTHSDTADSPEEKDGAGTAGANIFSTWPTPAAQSPQKRPFSLRKSTLQQRSSAARTRLFPDSAAREPALSPALTRARSRISLDSALPLRTFDFDTPSRRGSLNDPPLLFPPPGQKPYRSAPKPHPLSHALTPSSSNGSLSQEPIQTVRKVNPGPLFDRQNGPNPPPAFSRSLPIGSLRPTRPDSSQDSSQDSAFATPDAYRMAKPLPQAFMSTGLISKRNRNLDMPPAAFDSSLNMPDTPSKKTHINFTGTPAPPSVIRISHGPHMFGGGPSTPYAGGRTPRISPESFGKAVSIFDAHASSSQRNRLGDGAYCSDVDDMHTSPTHHLDRQPSCDELPPTPTKSNSTTTRPQSKGKNNSLRSSLFGRRPSLAPDTFASPSASEASSSEQKDSGIPSGSENSSARNPPDTPHDSFQAPPDPSCLSISAEKRRRTSFGVSAGAKFPPATPTGPRGDHSLRASIGQGHASSSYFANDVDTALSSRFGLVTTLGIGEFSQVYRVEKPLADGVPSLWSASSTPKASSLKVRVWAVKKSRRPYMGNRDRQRKMREVRILEKLRGHEHLVELVDHWEAKNHLYIQTEFYENGNLKDFLLQTGFKGRLDDFRIWKILLELGRGVKAIHDADFIHLDLKPANVFIDWEGVLKIGDFGMASSWPAPAGLDGEGDREYIGPEVLSGRFDKPADVFALGMIMLEIAGNIVLPDNGTSWQRLRAGDMSDLPSLTWSSDSSLARDGAGEPIETSSDPSCSAESVGITVENHGTGNDVDDDDDDLSFLRPTSVTRRDRRHDLVTPPNFMVDPNDVDSLDRVVLRMIRPDPDARPRVDDVLRVGGVSWVERRRRAGATVYEGIWGPADDVLGVENKEGTNAVTPPPPPPRAATEGGLWQAQMSIDVEMTDL